MFPNAVGKVKGEKQSYVGDQLVEGVDISSISLRRPADRCVLLPLPSLPLSHVKILIFQFISHFFAVFFPGITKMPSHLSASSSTPCRGATILYPSYLPLTCLKRHVRPSPDNKTPLARMARITSGIA